MRGRPLPAALTVDPAAGLSAPTTSTAVVSIVTPEQMSSVRMRYHAARALLAIHDLPAEPQDPEHMLYRLMSDDATRRDGGRRDLLAAIAATPSPPARN